jgi:hypothetical protein
MKDEKRKVSRRRGWVAANADLVDKFIDLPEEAVMGLRQWLRQAIKEIEDEERGKKL